MTAAESSEDAGQQESDRCARVVTRTTADDELVYAVIIALDEGAGHEGAHAVAEKGQREAGILRADPLVDELGIVDESPPAPIIHESEIIGALHALTVSALIMDDTHIAFGGHIPHEGQIAFLMVAHAMDQLQNGTGSRVGWRDELNGEIQSVGIGLKCEFLFHHW